MIANLGVSIPVFVLGLLLAYLFGVILKDTSGRAPAVGAADAPGPPSIRWPRLWGLQGLGGPPRAILDFVSNMYTFNAVLTGNLALLGSVPAT